MPKAPPKRKAANGYKLAEPLPLGEVLQDISKKHWKLGPSIGQGGFGEIYSAREATDKSTKYPYVIKIEPHSNGPLFVEMHFYMRNCKKEDVEDFKKKMDLKTFGMPLYLGSGSHEYGGEKYRFIVMEKFGRDLWKIFLENNRIFPTTTVFKIAIQMLDVLEYIHSKGYVHADLKGANILMGVTKDTQNKQMYLVDFGLATKYNDEPEFKPNPKKAHDGTIEYLSRDAHQGVQTRRGDLEILAYNIVQWLGCVLPWEKNLKDPNSVYKSKEEHMSSIPKFMKTCFAKKSPPGPLVEFLGYLSILKHNSKPDYKKIKKIFSKGLTSGDTLDKPFNFSVSNKTPSKRTPVKRTNNETPASTPKRKSARRSSTSESSEDEKENMNEEQSDSDTSDSLEEVVTTRTRQRKKPANYDENSDNEKPKRTKKKLVKESISEEAQSGSLNGYTDAMREVLQRKLEKDKSKGKHKLPKKSAVDEMAGFTDSMKEIAMKKKERLGKKGTTK